jgi:predicted O-methyltransferase YrrM
MSEIFELAGKLKGFLEPEEGHRLYEMAAEAVSLGPCLEIGSYCGKSALYLGKACQENGTVLFSVDHHRGSEEQQPGEAYFDPSVFNPATWEVDTFGAFRQAIRQAELENVVVPLVCSSATAAKAWSIPLGLVFVDGGHAYDTVLNDYQSWSRHILPGGYLLIHDIFEDPAKGGQAPYRVYQAALASGQYNALPSTGTLGVLLRTKP